MDFNWVLLGFSGILMVFYWVWVEYAVNSFSICGLESSHGGMGELPRSGR